MNHYDDKQSGEDADQGSKTTYGLRRLCQAADRGSVPQGAVLLQRDEVCRVIYKIIDDWEPAKEMRALKHGPLILGAMASLSGALFTTHFRQRMMLRHRARMVSYVPTVVIPFIATALLQENMQQDRLLGMKPPCLLCSEVNAVSVQLLVGVVQPYLLSVCAAAAVAKLTMVYPLPPLTDIKACYRTMRVLSQRIGSFMLLAVAGSIANAAVVAYSMDKASARVHAKLAERGTFLN